MVKTDAGLGILVCDTGPLLHLHEMGCLDLLDDADLLMLPTAVRDEIVFLGFSEILRRLERANLQIAESKASINNRCEALSEIFALHQGERECLSLCANLPNPMFLTDDFAARLTAIALGLRVHGTIGLIVRAVRVGRRTAEQAVTILRDIPDKSSLFIKRSLLNEIIQQIQMHSRE